MQVELIVCNCGFLMQSLVKMNLIRRVPSGVLDAVELSTRGLRMIIAAYMHCTASVQYVQCVDRRGRKSR